jgi:hypothetical protein
MANYMVKQRAAMVDGSFTQVEPASDFQLENMNSSFPWEGNGFCMAANTFSDTNGTRLILTPCSYYDTSQYFNPG